jgi:hypothetical protein
MIIHSPIFSGSINQAESAYANLSGSFSGSFTGVGNFVGLEADSVAYSNVTGKPALVSGSSQISYDGLSNIPSGIISSSAQIDSLFNIDGLISGSSQVDIMSTTNIPKLATTGSNIFIGTQVISGSLTVTGSATFTNVGPTILSGSISQVNLGDGNIIISDTPITSLNATAPLGIQNTIIGSDAGQSITDGYSNSFFGRSAGRDNTIGDNNTYIGLAAGQQNITGSSNTFIGSSAGQSNKVSYNTFVGMNSGNNNKTGASNTFVGYQSGVNNGVGNNNTYIGNNAAALNQSGSSNTSVGAESLYSNLYGVGNSIVGFQALKAETGGSYNTVLGHRAGFYQPNYISELQAAAYSIFIGAEASGISGATNQIVIGYLAAGNGTDTTTIGNNTTVATYLRGKLILSGSVAQEVTGSVNVDGAITATSFNGVINATNGVISGSSQVDLSNYVDRSTTQIVSGSKVFADQIIVNDTATFSGGPSAAYSVGISGDVQHLGDYNLTGSFNLFGNQTITGSLFVTQDLIVQGSSSIQTISSSRLDIGDNIIQLNVNSPSLRFGGLAINDSGSEGYSGSFLYDSIQDEFIFVHKGNGTNVTSSHFVLGPETFDDLGNEIYLTNNKLPKGTGKEHLVDSNITDNGTTITLGSNTVISGTIVASGTALVSGSSQITYANISSIPAGIVSGSAQVTPLLPTGTVSGSSQIDVASTTGDIALGTRTSGNYVASLVAGTGVTLSNNSGEGATPTIAIGQAVATNSEVQFAKVGVGGASDATYELKVTGDIGATGDIVAYVSSDERLKNNVEVISNPIEKVQALRGVTWEWNNLASDAAKQSPNLGVIAQEVEAVLPQLVHDRENGFKGVDYAKLTGLLIEAIKEQQKQIDELKSRLK